MKVRIKTLEEIQALHGVYHRAAGYYSKEGIGVIDDFGLLDSAGKEQEGIKQEFTGAYEINGWYYPEWAVEEVDSEQNNDNIVREQLNL